MIRAVKIHDVKKVNLCTLKATKTAPCGYAAIMTTAQKVIR